MNPVEKAADWSRVCVWCGRSNCMAWLRGVPTWGSEDEKRSTTDAWQAECANETARRRRERGVR